MRMADRVNPTKLDAWGLKAEFAEALDKVETLIPPTPRAASPALADQPPGGPVLTDPFRLLPDSPPQVFAPPIMASPAPAPEQVSLSPVRSILADWMELSSSMRALADQSRRNASKPKKRFATVEEAARELGLSADELAAVRQLEQLRNNVAHSANAPVAAVDAARFRMAKSELLVRLEKIAEQLNAGGVAEEEPVGG